MTRPRLLDLFCCEGGAARGYADAGFEVVGVDIEPQPLYPFEFHQSDAMTWPLDGFDAVHASPPCKEHTALFKTLPAEAAAKHDTGWMLSATIARLTEWGGLWVVENVEGPDLPGALTLCGKEFGLEDERYALKRHRQFISSVPLMGAGGCAGMHGRRGKEIIGVYGDLSAKDRRTGRGAARMRAGVERARQLMDMPWASAHGLSQAIPPAYSQFIGEQLIDWLRAAGHPLGDSSPSHRFDTDASPDQGTRSRPRTDALSGSASCGRSGLAVSGVSAASSPRTALLQGERG